MTRIKNIAAVPVGDHEIIAYFEIALSAGTLEDKTARDPLRDGPGTTLGAFSAPSPGGTARKKDASGSPIPRDQYDGLLNRYRSESVWQKAENVVGSDLHEYIRRILAGENPDLASFWTLGKQAARFVNSADLYPAPTTEDERKAISGSRIAKAIRLDLSKGAQERLRVHGVEPAPLRIILGDLRLAAFATGRGIAMVPITLARLSDTSVPTAIELLEAVIAVNRGHLLSWCSAKDGVPVEGEAFSLIALVQRLLFGGPSSAEARNFKGRGHTYAFVRFDDVVPVADRDALAVYMARHYTSDYAVSGEAAGRISVADFDTVRHAIALEGAATVVGPTADHPHLTSFLKDFRTTTFQRHYALVALLALHEHAYLLESVAGSVKALTQPKDEKVKKQARQDEERADKLGKLQSDFLDFRLRFRFPEVSHISMHNAVHRAFRKALALDRLLDERAADIGDHAADLQFQLDQRRNGSFRWVSAFAAAGVAGLTMFTLVKEIGTLLLEPATAGWAGVVMGLTIAIVAGIATWWRGPGSTPIAHVAAHRVWPRRGLR